MIEREFIKEKTKYLKIKEYIDSVIGSAAGVGKIIVEKTPLGEKILVYAVRPGLIIGRGGTMIQELTVTLRNKFKLDNPQIEVTELENPNLSAAVMSKKVAADLERFGSSRFKAIGYRTLMQIMKSGALGAEIMISGRGVPGARAHSWRFPAGHMKKSGQVALEQIDHVKTGANLRSGTVGIQVRIMHPDIYQPDIIKITEGVHIPEEVQKEIDMLEAEEQKAQKLLLKNTEPKPKKKKAEATDQIVTEIQEVKPKKKAKPKLSEAELGPAKQDVSLGKSDTDSEKTNTISQDEVSEEPNENATQEANNEEVIQDTEKSGQ